MRIVDEMNASPRFGTKPPRLWKPLEIRRSEARTLLSVYNDAHYALADDLTVEEAKQIIAALVAQVASDELDRLRKRVRWLESVLPEQYASGFRDGVAAARPLDPAAPFVVGPDAG